MFHVMPTTLTDQRTSSDWEVVKITFSIIATVGNLYMYDFLIFESVWAHDINESMLSIYVDLISSDFFHVCKIP